MTTKPLLMESTTIDPGRTAAEIISVLVAAGANQINQSFEAGKITGIRWTFRIGGEDVLFDMPARIEPVFKIFRKRRIGWVSERDEQLLRQKAERVAWRQLLRWVQAQVAMIQTGMVRAEEVFLPYLFDPVRNQTLFESMAESRFKMLAPPEKPDKPQ